MKDNPNRRKAKIWAIVALLATFAAFTLLISGMYEFSKSFPMWDSV